MPKSKIIVLHIVIKLLGRILLQGHAFEDVAEIGDRSIDHVQEGALYRKEPYKPQKGQHGQTLRQHAFYVWGSNPPAAALKMSLLGVYPSARRGSNAKNRFFFFWYKKKVLFLDRKTIPSLYKPKIFCLYKKIPILFGRRFPSCARGGSSYSTRTRSLSQKPSSMKKMFFLHKKKILLKDF